MKSGGKVFIIVAPSGSGKSTLIKRIRLDFPVLKESISHTTRQIRTKEIHGKNYYFISREEFEENREKDEYLEWAEVHGNLYGTPKKLVENCIKNNESILFDLDLKGVDSLLEKIEESIIVIFIAPPSIEVLEKRLRARKTETENDIKIRINNAKRELERKDDFNYLIVNDDLEKTYSQLYDCFKKELEEVDV